ncbi:hypothetical protein ACPXCP_39825 [Streptomyces sp. DT20]|uniref:hypothetical protein n=1 Tax=Streptomyces sp. DT20 TaxID=3416519 RepID=UPI003CF3E65A
MSIVAERVLRVLRAELAEELDRQESEDDAQGPEPEGRFVLRAGRWVRVEREVPLLPSLLPPGYVPVVERGTEPGSDEIRLRTLMIAAQDRYGWARCGGSL